jgi:hypothetical protein
MPSAHLIENPYFYSNDTASFFRGFIVAQDEVPLGLSRISLQKDATLYKVPLKDKIVQVRISEENLLRKSMFTGHQLKPSHQGPVKREQDSSDWIFLTLILCTVLLLIAKLLFERRFGQILKAVTRPRNLNILLRDGNLLSERITPPLLILHMLSYSLFFYLYMQSRLSIPGIFKGEIFYFAAILGAYVSFFTFRFLLVRLLGWIFASGEYAQTYLANSVIFDEVWGIALIPICLIIYYAPSPASGLMLQGGAVLFLILQLYKLIRNFMVGLANTNFSWFYLFLYLCTVEILPILFLGKLISNWLSA